MRRFLYLLSVCALLLAGQSVNADLIKQSAAGGYTKTFLLTSISNGQAGLTGLAPTAKIRKAGGTYVAATNTVTEVDAVNDPGRYQLIYTATEINTLGLLDVAVTATGANNESLHDQVVAFDPNDSAALGLTAVPINLAQPLDVTPTVGTVGQGIWYGSQKMGRMGQAQAGSSTTITLDSSASSTDNIYASHFIKIYSGAGSGQFATITAYNGTTKVATITRPGAGTWSTPPNSTSLFWIEPEVFSTVQTVLDANVIASQGDVTTIKTRIGTPGGASLSADVSTLLTRIPSTISLPNNFSFLGINSSGQFTNTTLALAPTGGGSALSSNQLSALDRLFAATNSSNQFTSSALALAPTGGGSALSANQLSALDRIYAATNVSNQFTAGAFALFPFPTNYLSSGQDAKLTLAGTSQQTGVAVTLPTTAPAGYGAGVGTYYAPVVDTMTGTSTAPTLAVAKNGSGQPVLTWTADASALSYKILRSTNGVSYTTISTVSSSVHTYTDSARPIGTVYYTIIGVH